MSIGSFLESLGSGFRQGRQISAPRQREQFRPRRQGVGFGFGAGSWGAGANFDPRTDRRPMEVIAAPSRRVATGPIDLSGSNNPDMGFVDSPRDSGRMVADMGGTSRSISMDNVVASGVDVTPSTRTPDVAEVEIERPNPAPSSSLPSQGGSSAAIINRLGDLDSAPTAGLRNLLPAQDNAVGDPRRSMFPTGAVLVDDPNIYSTEVTGDIEGVAPDLIASLGNSAEMSHGPKSRVIVGSGLRTGPASASDHNSGEAADFAVIDRHGVRSDYADPRVYDMARVAVARGPVQAVGIGENYMGGDDFHFGTGRGQGRDYIRTWSDWNTGAERARYGTGAADEGGAGDPNWNFAGELEGIQDSRQIAVERNMPTPVAAAPERSVRPPVRSAELETTASTRRPDVAEVDADRIPMDLRGDAHATEIYTGLYQRFAGMDGVDEQTAAVLSRAFLENFRHESGLDLDVIERVPNVHGTRGRGLYQVTGSRRAQFEERTGGDYTLEPQLDFAIWELQNTERRAWDRILAAAQTGDVGRTASAIVSDFLRPAAQHRDRRIAEYTTREYRSAPSKRQREQRQPYWVRKMMEAS